MANTNVVSTGAELETPEDVRNKISGIMANTDISTSAAVPADLASVNDYVTKAATSLDKMNAANADFMSGKISSDVLAEMKRTAAESSAMQGFGVGKMGAVKTLRDIGLKSTSMVQQGMQNQATITEGYKGLAGVQEAVREYNSSFAQNAEQLRNAAKTTALSGLSTGLEYSQFRATLTNTVNQQIATLATFKEDLLYKYNASGMHDDFKDSFDSLNSLIDSLSATLGGTASTSSVGGSASTTVNLPPSSSPDIDIPVENSRKPFAYTEQAYRDLFGKTPTARELREWQIQIQELTK